MTINDRISPEYRAEMTRLHADPRGFGEKGHRWLDTVRELHAPVGGHILDYGCGTGSLVEALVDLGYSAKGYDPGNPEFSDADPYPTSFVVCTDVLEHIEPDKIGAVLAHLRSLTKRKLFVVVSTVETAKTLSDGRQAHILLHDQAWWVEQFKMAGFGVGEPVDCPKPEKQFGMLLS